MIKNNYKKAIREENSPLEYLGIHSMSAQSGPARSGTPQIQSIIIVAITLFAFSGLMVGFTVGALAHNKKSTNNANQTPIIANHITPTPAPTQTPTITTFIALGPPNPPVLSQTANANGTTPTYTGTIQAKDKADQTKLITADGITCRLWLVPQGANPETDPGTHFLTTAADQLQHVDHLAQPFPQEIQNGLVFDPSTPTEVQPCVKGTATWKFTIASSVAKGNYYVVGLTDWQGKSYNWAWKSITVDGKKQNN
jgi:hypothetical protein